MSAARRWRALRRLGPAAVGAMFLACAAPALAQTESFLIEDIRVEGIQRISAGTVFNELPIEVGDTITGEDIARSIKALFNTGLFSDVRIERDGAALVVVVEERPAISAITFSGNRVLKTEDLREALAQVDFIEGRTYDPAVFDRTVQELRDTYFGRGRYSAEIEATATPLERNRIAIHFKIDEGTLARIRRINIVGNRDFEEEDLLELFNSSTRKMFSWLTGSDRYSKQTLTADLDNLRKHYLDLGYINFSVNSTQVSITPDMRRIHITINITEGKAFEVGDVDLAGNLVVAPEELIPLVDVREGDIFNRSALEETVEDLKTRLGDEGYAFANVNPTPNIDEEAGRVDIAFLIDPGQRVYVRRIEFRGNLQTREEVLRREMRQLEGSWVVNRDLSRSRQRLLQLGYFTDVTIERNPVPGVDDQVDIIVRVTERPSGTLLAGVGYSGDRGAVLNLSVTQENLFGTGNALSFSFDNSDSTESFGFSYENPYYTRDGISRQIFARYQETDGTEANIASYLTNEARVGAGFGIPISEYDRFTTVFAAELVEFTAGNNASDEVKAFRDKVGAENEDTYIQLLTTGRWSRDSRDRRILPSRGGRASASAEVAVPGSKFYYFRLRNEYQRFIPLSEKWTLMGEYELGYGDGYGRTDTLPLTNQYYAGGSRSVRGFKANTLGPRDSANKPLGGSLLTVGRAEVIFPLPFVDDSTQFRMTGFFDAGNAFTGLDDFDLGELRFSTGFSTIWIAGIGIITTSWGFPLNDEEEDQTQRFQFTLGTNF